MLSPIAQRVVGLVAREPGEYEKGDLVLVAGRITPPGGPEARTYVDEAIEAGRITGRRPYSSSSHEFFYPVTSPSTQSL